MTTYVSENFANFATGWTTGTAAGGTIARSTIQVYAGSYSCRIRSVADASSAYAFKTFTRFPVDGNEHVRIWLYVEGSETTDNDVAIFYLNDTVQAKTSIWCAVRYAAGAYWLRNAVGGVFQNVCMLTPNVWNQIDAFYNYTTGKIHYYVNGLQVGVDWESSAGISIRANVIYIGDTSTDSPAVYAGYIYLDDLVVDDLAESVAKTSPTKGSSASTQTRSGATASQPLDLGARMKVVGHTTISPDTIS